MMQCSHLKAIFYSINKNITLDRTQRIELIITKRLPAIKFGWPCVSEISRLSLATLHVRSNRFPRSLTGVRAVCRGTGEKVHVCRAFLLIYFAIRGSGCYFYFRCITSFLQHYLVIVIDFMSLQCVAQVVTIYKLFLQAKCSSL